MLAWQRPSCRSQAGMPQTLKPPTRAFPSEPQKRLKAWRLTEAILKPAPKLPPDEWARLPPVDMGRAGGQFLAGSDRQVSRGRVRSS